MAWVRIDDRFASHPKVLAAGPLAMAMQVAALCYCNRELTNGFIPRSAARTLLDWEIVRADDRVYRIGRSCGMSGDDLDCAWVIGILIETGMWEEAQGGYQIHDYLEYQPSREQVEEERAKTARRQEEWRAKRRGGVTADVDNASSNAVTNEESNDVTNEPVTGAPKPKPKPKPKSSSVPEEEKEYIHSAETTPISDEPRKPLPMNGVAQEIVAAFCKCAGIEQPAVYRKAIGQAQQLVKAGITVEDIPSLFAAANWGDGADLGKMLNAVDRWRSSKAAPPSSDRPIRWPDWLRKRIDVHLQECAVNKCDPDPYPVDLQRDMDAYAKSMRVVA